MYRIIDKKVLNEHVDQMIIEAPLVANNAKPGHFVILRVDEDGERIPLTIVEHDQNTVTIIYQKLGYSTRLLGKLETGDEIHDFVGPLGRPAHIHDVQQLLAVAGGVGAAPLFPQLKAYYDKGVNIDLVFGAKSKDYLILLDKYKNICRNIYITTDDGSLGTKGFVTTVVQDLLTTKSYDRAVTIGPLIMMRNVVELTKSIDLPTDVSLNPIMIDGTGMCGNCRFTKNGKTYFACIDGPDFDADGIDFDELMVRQNYYIEEEHICNLGLNTNEDS
ncbi:sulfide/dihydroorotate dehydrogenase-like FAD/NAD-binding protein [Candidatus Xianfuyuplasma coldseepsis]|uniref:Sulfide/dihydroorotate dehydrogenase-like FAD/NAD-binding protein n=1 Tax=Candidatus Xianfuyuplasma coldseepsis TaxID=2782163 RepID=A0A7L7KNX9_9MOLU|nr:sulfide/dihydroorotate dehydrogenase-like FAD/NAD-binding protein [Xianfuyuplasma coldseepsis]QMS84480.1 sulfide/dihydroorotate dehydrogenase-like FAD/NAD-binding protein [Xianfuyuplasma coldseepsis]